VDVQQREFALDQVAAAKMGQSVEDYRTGREERIEKWTKRFHNEMTRWGTDDPLQVLPCVMSKVEEIAIAEARSAANKAAAAALMHLKASLRKGLK
jgi:hypothetical protein